MDHLNREINRLSQDILIKSKHANKIISANVCHKMYY